MGPINQTPQGLCWGTEGTERGGSGKKTEAERKRVRNRESSCGSPTFLRQTQLGTALTVSGPWGPRLPRCGAAASGAWSTPGEEPPVQPPRPCIREVRTARGEGVPRTRDGGAPPGGSLGPGASIRVVPSTAQWLRPREVGGSPSPRVLCRALRRAVPR